MRVLPDGVHPRPNEVFGESLPLNVLCASAVPEDGHGVDAPLLAEVSHDSRGRLKGVGDVTHEPRNRAWSRLTKSVIWNNYGLDVQLQCILITYVQ